jgi:hypothetical protein
MLNELIDSHVKEINLSLEKHKNKLNEKYVNRLEKFLDMLNDDDKMKAWVEERNTLNKLLSLDASGLLEEEQRNDYQQE